MEQLSLREFIEKRETEIKNLMVSLKKELKELRVARVAIIGDSPTPKSADVKEADSGAARLTIKEMALHVLESHGGSGTAEDILEWIKAEFEKSIERSSLSPQLSRLKADGQLELDQQSMVWKCTGDSPDTVEILV